MKRKKQIESNLQTRHNLRSRKRSEVLQRALKEPLSPRELQVLIALGEGKTTVQIRSALSVSEKTIATYVHRLKKKLELTNINELIRAAALLRAGIIPSAPRASSNGSLRLCPRCQELFSAKPPKQDIPALAGYKVLAALLRRLV